MLENHLSIRIPAAEMIILEQYCKKYKRTKTDVLREFIRSLAQKAESQAGAVLGSPQVEHPARPVFTAKSGGDFAKSGGDFTDGVSPSDRQLFKTTDGVSPSDRQLFKTDGGTPSGGELFKTIE
jgi:hypothetical protein